MPVTVQLPICHCNQCGADFPIRTDKLPARCPRCHSRRLHKSGPHDYPKQSQELQPADHSQNWSWGQPVCLKDVLAQESELARPLKSTYVKPSLRRRNGET